MNREKSHKFDMKVYSVHYIFISLNSFRFFYIQNAVKINRTCLIDAKFLQIITTFKEQYIGFLFSIIPPLSLPLITVLLRLHFFFILHFYTVLYFSFAISVFYLKLMRVWYSLKQRSTHSPTSQSWQAHLSVSATLSVPPINSWQSCWWNFRWFIFGWTRNV